MAENIKEEIKIDEALVSECISKDVLTFEGVSRFSDNSIVDSITRSVQGKDVIARGIDITLSEEGLIIGIHIHVYYGVNIPQLSYDIQCKVKNDIEDRTGIDVQSVNISIDGIDRIKE